MYIAQQCFGLSDQGIEDALYDSQSIRRFVGVDLGREGAPDATTLVKFRRLLEEHKLTERIFEAIKTHLADKGLSFGRVLSSTRPSSLHRPRPTTPRRSATPRCTRPRRAINGISA